MTMPATRTDLFALLDRLGIAHVTTAHEPAFTVAESAHLKAGIPGGHTKNLFLKDKKSRFFVIVALSDAVIDLKRLHERIGASGRLSFGTAEQLEALWGVKPGSVTLFGAINDIHGRVTVVLDQAMFVHDRLNAHPLENTATTTIAAADVARFLRATGHEPLVVPVSEA